MCAPKRHLDFFLICLQSRGNRNSSGQHSPHLGTYFGSTFSPFWIRHCGVRNCALRCMCVSKLHVQDEQDTRETKKKTDNKCPLKTSIHNNTVKVEKRASVGCSYAYANESARNRRAYGYFRDIANDRKIAWRYDRLGITLKCVVFKKNTINYCTTASTLGVSYALVYLLSAVEPDVAVFTRGLSPCVSVGLTQAKQA